MTLKIALNSRILVFGQTQEMENIAKGSVSFKFLPECLDSIILS